MDKKNCKMGKWKVYLPEKHPDFIVLEKADNSKQIRFLETAKGKKERYEAELKTGRSLYSVALGDRYPEHALTVEEKAFRKGWLAAFREQERIRKKSRRK